MPGDYTRFTFKPGKHFSGVLKQQGRVDLDADWNEAVHIEKRRLTSETLDLVGRTGVPVINGHNGDAFKIERATSSGGTETVTIAPGRIYVDGLQAENFGNGTETFDPVLEESRPLDPVLYAKQPFLFDADPGEPIPGSGKTKLVYLDVWQRELTHVEDSDILEIALGVADTATRLQTVWQVKAIEVGNVTCTDHMPEWDALNTPPSGRLTTTTKTPEPEISFCAISQEGGYTGVENRLYRVEIHRGGLIGGTEPPQFKWSRDNGSIATGVLSMEHVPGPPAQTKIQAENLGRDRFLSFRKHDWIEITDDHREFHPDPKERAGFITQIKDVNVADQMLTVEPAVPSSGYGFDASKPERHTRIRRWDRRDETDAADKALIDVTAGKIELENGIEVEFSSEGGGPFRVGDYWLFAARSANGSIDMLEGAPPRGIHHHFAKLALIKHGGSEPEDCRILFPPLTELTTLLYESGDGQEAMPGAPLPEKLAVRVVKGSMPVIGAKVRFMVVKSSDDTTVVSEDVDTLGPDGMAEYTWPKAYISEHRVKAVLLDRNGNEAYGQVVHFNAGLSVASDVYYNPADCSALDGITTVQGAIDELCQIKAGGGCAVRVGDGAPHGTLDSAIYDLLSKGRTDICLCLLPGKQTLPSVSWDEMAELLKKQKERVRLKITGCGYGTRIELNKPLPLTNLESFILRDVEIYLGKDFSAGKEKGAMVFDGCNTFILESCRIEGMIEEDKALVVIEDPNSVRFRDNIMVAWSKKSLERPEKLFEEAKLPEFKKLFGILALEEFREASSRLGNELAKRSEEDQEKMRGQLEKALERLGTRLSLVEGLSYERFMHGLKNKALDPELGASLLDDIRLAAIKTSPGAAIILGGVAVTDKPLSPADQIKAMDEDDYVTLRDNQIIGAVGVYGSPSWVEVSNERVKELVEDLKKRGLHGFMGSLQVHGNQLTSLLMPREVMTDIENIIKGEKHTGLYGRCLFTDNIVEGPGIQIMAQHVVVNTNHFSFSAMPGKTAPTFGTTIADTAVLLGNCGRGVFQEVSRKSERVANIEITFVP